MLHRVPTIAALHDLLRSARSGGARIGLVPTMGALHDGHASLIRTAALQCDVVVTTIFVNPLQFAPTEDLSAYPRDLDGDYDLAEQAGASVLFTPTIDEMYPFGPSGVLTNVTVRGLTDVLEGAQRPGHFDGVATVVAKLFAMAGECRAFFGEKDFQQLAVVRRMAADLSFPVEIVGCPTVREDNGLAMSSRNRYLTPDEFSRASVIHRALVTGRDMIAAGERNPLQVRAAMTAVLSSEPLAQVQYAEVVDAATLTAPAVLNGDVRLLIAARFGKARLIDNIGAVAV